MSPIILSLIFVQSIPKLKSLPRYVKLSSIFRGRILSKLILNKDNIDKIS